MENEDLKKLLEDRVEINLKHLNETLKESQERVRQYAAALGQLREETQRFADVISKLNHLLAQIFKSICLTNFFGTSLETCTSLICNLTGRNRRIENPVCKQVSD